MKMKTAIPGYYRVPEAAKVLGKSREMVCRYIRMKLLPAFRAGRAWIIQQSDVHEFQPPPPGNPNFRKRVKSNGKTT